MCPPALDPARSRVPKPKCDISLFASYEQKGKEFAKQYNQGKKKKKKKKVKALVMKQTPW